MFAIGSPFIYFPVIASYPEAFISFEPWQFMTSILAPSGVVIMWVDLMKYGRVSSKDLDDVTNKIKKVLSRKPSHTCCFLLAPFLISERVQNGHRGELRTQGWNMSGYIIIATGWIISTSLTNSCWSQPIPIAHIDDGLAHIQPIACIPSQDCNPFQRKEDRGQARCKKPSELYRKCAVPTTTFIEESSDQLLGLPCLHGWRCDQQHLLQFHADARQDSSQNLLLADRSNKIATR